MLIIMRHSLRPDDCAGYTVILRRILAGHGECKRLIHLYLHIILGGMRIWIESGDRIVLVDEANPPKEGLRTATTKISSWVPTPPGTPPCWVRSHVVHAAQAEVLLAVGVVGVEPPTSPALSVARNNPDYKRFYALTRHRYTLSSDNSVCYRGKSTTLALNFWPGAKLGTNVSRVQF
jgi:hypothetical protein